jgi:hypothetical protein
LILLVMKGWRVFGELFLGPIGCGFLNVEFF